MLQANFIPILTATATATENLSSRAELNHSLANDSRSRGTCCWPVADPSSQDAARAKILVSREYGCREVLRLRRPIRKRIGLLRSG